MKPPPQDYATAASFRSMLTTICLRPEDRQSAYDRFLAQKAQDTSQSGFAPRWLPDFLFDFQQALVDWAIRKGRAALYVDTGLGKSVMQLVWAQNVIEHTNKPVLILTPLAVSFQTVSEAEKFGIDAVRVRDGTIGAPRIYVTNYEKLAHFSPSDFSGVVADESSRLKAFDAATLKAVLEFVRKIPYRLLCTATPAPNDYVELGTSAEALGILRRVEMLAHYFTHDSGNTSQWRLKKHAARAAFWQWVNSWARTMRKPSDLGFDDTRFVLPPLTERVHMVKEDRPPDGLLFTLPAITLNEQRDERRRTIDERCELAAALVNETSEPAVVWCHLNSEGDLLEKLIPSAEQVSGADSDERKEEVLIRFTRGETRVLVSKSRIFGWGMNWQHCAHVVTFPSHSWEAYYQAIRRCYRFGQTRPVVVDLITTSGETNVLKNLQRKAKQAEAMFASLVTYTTEATTTPRQNEHMKDEVIPSWLLSNK